MTALATAQLASALPRGPSHHRRATGGAPSTDGVKFSLNGATDYFAGSNAYWLGFQQDPADVDLVFDHLKESGLKVLRVWGFNDVNEKPGEGEAWFQLHADGTSKINTGADGLERLDTVVASAEKHGIKLIIPFINYWTDYGGMAAYAKAYGGSTSEDFYGNEKAQAAYKTYIKAVVSRYSNSSGIFAWELANEPRCKQCETSVLTGWITETSKYIKSLDSQHMVAIGDEGFGLKTQSDGSYPFGFDEGSDFAKNLAIDTIDFGTFHLYPDSWGTDNEWGNLWIKAHGAACMAANKPCLFEEYGATSDQCTIEKPWQQTALKTEGLSGDLFWQFGDKLSSGQSPDDQNTLYFGSEEYECLVTDHVKEIGAKSLAKRFPHIRHE
ncbi:endo-beta-1,4-mannanase [Aspergillus campestris IBT 28561]|uniref:mannan endo-1,4-beta-mannosidase n=1 Tax=Aspergillus campestris (strain IBT 28561) TaxID=1392248 RepID=A0A2I1CS66_ASPC2|nr:endo-beta-1,4-mannanase [Aspergillus campestris IBT 28561]PKY00451.1 endo-beta-1,4-mannanase [Aspergillus campestris IBT 28561]